MFVNTVSQAEGINVDTFRLFNEEAIDQSYSKAMFLAGNNFECLQNWATAIKGLINNPNISINIELNLYATHK